MSPKIKATRLSSAVDVVDVLGGVEAVKKLTGARLKAIYHWRSTGQFPARQHDLMVKALRRRGYTAPAVLWNQAENKKAA